MENFSFEGMSDEQISYDFNRIKSEILVKNYLSIMDQLIPYYDTLAQAQGELKSQADIFEQAHNAFCLAKKENRINELNEIINAII